MSERRRIRSEAEITQLVKLTLESETLLFRVLHGWFGKKRHQFSDDGRGFDELIVFLEHLESKLLNLDVHANQVDWIVVSKRALLANQLDVLEGYFNFLSEVGLVEVDRASYVRVRRNVVHFLFLCRQFFLDFVVAVVGRRYVKIRHDEELLGILDELFQAFGQKSVNYVRKVFLQLLFLYTLVQHGYTASVNAKSQLQSLPSEVYYTRAQLWERWFDFKEKYNIDEIQHTVTFNRADFLLREVELLGISTVYEHCSRHQNPRFRGTRTNCYHISVKKLLSLVEWYFKYVLLFKVLSVWLQHDELYVPLHFWKKMVTYGIDKIEVLKDALKAAYVSAAASEEWLLIIIPRTLVGDDPESLDAIRRVLEKPNTLLTSLIYKVPITNAEDDAVVRHIDENGGRLYVALEPTINYLPLAVTDQKKLYFTLMTREEEVYPRLYIEATHPKFIREIVEEFNRFREQNLIYEAIYDYLWNVYHWYYKTGYVQALDEETEVWLKEHKLLNEKGELTDLGKIIVEKRLY